MNTLEQSHQALIAAIHLLLKNGSANTRTQRIQLTVSFSDMAQVEKTLAAAQLIEAFKD